MKTSSIILLALSLLAFTGCRREDIREMTVTMPGLTEANKAKVTEAIGKYAGVIPDSYRWDLKAGTLTLRYDSMKVAQANIRYAIEEKGIKVVYPQKNGNHAGY